MKHFFFILWVIFPLSGLAQDASALLKTKKIAVKNRVLIDSLSINPSQFIIKNSQGKVIDSSLYKIDFAKGLLFLNTEAFNPNDSLTVHYLPYPKFLTKSYFKYDTAIIVDNRADLSKLYSLNQTSKERSFIPFDGLNTSGSLSRGISIGNNQNAVVNSQLDLQITGKINDKISIRASIQDANIPTQQGGYSQNLDEFDQIFIELYGDNWNIRAGDVNIENKQSYFANFSKKIQGISLGATLNHKASKTEIFAAGALVRGVFSQSKFVGQEGNQGPYKLVGPNGELFVLIVSGSERVYVNGLLVERGENKDYIIDYNAGEIRFNATYPINNNMRITVEYQFSERSYTRFIAYGGANYSSKNLDIGTFVYSENDAKNQPLQQSLSQEQVGILREAGDDLNKMIAPSDFPDTFSENKTLYRKDLINGQEVFVFSTNPEDELFSVRFSKVGANQGNYVLSNTIAINRVFEYVPPIDGLKQGDFAPIIRLDAPNNLQLAGIMGSYQPSEKTTIDFELTGSKNDLNLFSDIDDQNNTGFAGKLDIKQQLLKNSDGLSLDAFINFNHIQEDFKTIERLYNVEFSRDWNLETTLGNQNFIRSGISGLIADKGEVRYEFQNLDFSENFKGTRHLFQSHFKFNGLSTSINASALNSDGENLASEFIRLNASLRYDTKKAWAGAKLSLEDNQQRFKANDSLTPISQKFNAYHLFTGIGDSTKVFVELGYRFRENDSLSNNNILKKVNHTNSYYLKSKPINTHNTQLSLFVNYRLLTPSDKNEKKERFLNSRLSYRQSFLNKGILWNTSFESNSGVLPQQEFTYIKVDPGKGVFTWNDYNENGIQELEEFEVALFQDQAQFIRVLLPNRIFVKIHQNKFGQSLIINPQLWLNDNRSKSIWAKFYNQTSYLIDRKTQRSGSSFNVNPFKDGANAELGLSLNFRNALYFNRGKQYYTTVYTYTATKNKTLLSSGAQENDLKSHQLLFTHKMGLSWLFNFKGTWRTNKSISENFSTRNFELNNYEANPELSYLFNRNARFNVFYQFLNSQNKLGEQELLDQHKLGFSFIYNKSEQFSLNGEFNFISNAFKGSPFSPVAYQILEGLQPGSNFTWNMLLQKKITKFLDINLSYFGRKSKDTKTIHTGNVQLRAFF